MLGAPIATSFLLMLAGSSLEFVWQSKKQCLSMTKSKIVIIDYDSGNLQSVFNACELVKNSSGLKSIPSEIVSQIHKKAQGNPFVTQEMVVSLRSARDSNKLTNQQFVAGAVEKRLPQLKSSLAELGLVAVAKLPRFVSTSTGSTGNCSSPK